MQNMPVQHDAVEPDYFDAPDPQEVEQRLIESLHAFAGRLSRLAQEQVAARQEIEQRWLEDIRQHHGQYAPDDIARMKAAGGSQVYVNVTRNKTQSFAARLQDMLFPTDDRSWAINPTPVPEGLQQPQAIDPQTGQPVPGPSLQALAEQTAELMQTEIDDQLSEARYQSLARDVIDDAAILGTGVIKGPVIVGKTNRTWQTDPASGVSMLIIEEDLRPSVERVSPWDFYPDMDAATLDDAEFVFQRHRFTKRRLREFARLPGVLQDEVRELVKAGAGENLADDYLSDIRDITGVASLSNDRGYEVWEYHGPISKEDLCACYEMAGMPMGEDEIDALHDEVSATVFFARNRVLRVSLNPLDTEDMPYSVFVAERDPSCIFGFGIPRMMRQAQRVMNAAWRMMMDNAGQSVADQLVINRDLIEPADGSWAYTPKKMWYLIDKTRSVQEAFATFNTPSHQQELANIFMLARQLADEETNLPLIAQGEQTDGQTQTAAGMSILMNSANIVLRRAVKNWDDDITRSLIGRFYDWNMQYNPKPEIKGDLVIEARGSGALLVREKQQQNLMIYSNLSAQNPELAIRRDWAGLDQEIAKSLEVPYENLTLPDEEIEAKRQQMQEQATQQPADPAVEARMAEIQMRGQLKQMELEEARMRHQAELQIQQLKMAMDREIKMIEIAAREQITMAELQSRLQLGAMKDKTEREKAATEAALRRGQQQLAMSNMSMGYDSV